MAVRTRAATTLAVSLVLAGCGGTIGSHEPAADGKPTTKRIEQNVRRQAKAYVLTQRRALQQGLLPAHKLRGPFSHVSCHQTNANKWFCWVWFKNGPLIEEWVTWYPQARSMGFAAATEIWPKA